MFSTETMLRVRYADTDQMKMVYYAKFLEYFEQGRSDLLRGMGLPYPEIEEMGYYLPVVEAHLRYLRSGRYDDALRVKTMVKEMPQVRIRIEYEVTNDATKELLVEGYTVHSFVNASTGRPARAPERFAEALGKVLRDKQ
jgi:acyl-CoA thioester hydrolase